ncbi:hypothetical protein [Bacillus rubiinfantis]|uniref:hypothetical protein n=1 Tax=Bacillus rubiinfantis TaxID=1499680 RepID=UPI0005A83031|nr:hypothetical protein [Bacillus rubiinfantis]
MNMKLKKGLFWGALITPIVIAISFLCGGGNAFARGFHGHGGNPGGPGGMGHQGGFGGGHQMMQGPHQGGGFSWLGLLLVIIIVTAVVVFLVKWLRRKSKASAMKQFIDTSLMSSYSPTIEQNATILDQWEQNIHIKKENK